MPPSDLIGGWELIQATPRYVARQRIVHTDDHSITLRYESSYTFKGLLKRLDWRRSYEAGRERRVR